MLALLFSPLIMGFESPPYLPTTIEAVELPLERGFRVPKNTCSDLDKI